LKFWIDALTPKQLIFFNTLSEKMKKSGHEVIFTTRSYHDVNYVIRRLGIEVTVVGKHGGSSKSTKLEASLSRSLELVRFIRDEKVDGTVSFNSPEAARVSFGLGIPHYTVNDSPHSVWVARLSIPLSRILFTPWVIPLSAWREYGIRKEMMVTYRALDPAAWLKRKDEWPPPTEFEKSARGAILFRPEESQASYMQEQKLKERVELVRMISESLPDNRVIVLPRYEQQEKEFDYVDAPNVFVCREPFFGPNLLTVCAALIGGGGTMNAEASLLGVPTISFFPGKTTYVEEYLVQRGLVRRVKKESDCLKAIKEVLKPESKDKIRKLAEQELAMMEDPTDVILSKVLSMSGIERNS
jgi:predicted glycosyltransferase